MPFSGHTRPSTRTKFRRACRACNRSKGTPFGIGSSMFRSGGKVPAGKPRRSGTRYPGRLRRERRCVKRGWQVQRYHRRGPSRGRCSAKSSPWAWIRSIGPACVCRDGLPMCRFGRAAAPHRRYAPAAAGSRLVCRRFPILPGRRRSSGAPRPPAPIERRENLLGAAHRVGTDRRQGITDTKDGQRHRGRPSRSSAAAAARRHPRRSMPQPSVS